jgi:hypothetical protein
VANVITRLRGLSYERVRHGFTQKYRKPGHHEQISGLNSTKTGCITDEKLSGRYPYMRILCNVFRKPSRVVLKDQFVLKVICRAKFSATAVALITFYYIIYRLLLQLICLSCSSLNLNLHRLSVCLAVCEANAYWLRGKKTLFSVRYQILTGSVNRA